MEVNKLALHALHDNQKHNACFLLVPTYTKLSICFAILFSQANAINNVYIMGADRNIFSGPCRDHTEIILAIAR